MSVATFGLKAAMCLVVRGCCASGSVIATAMDDMNVATVTVPVPSICSFMARGRAIYMDGAGQTG